MEKQLACSIVTVPGGSHRHPRVLLYNPLYCEYLIRSISDFAPDNFCCLVEGEFVTQAAHESQSTSPAASRTISCNNPYLYTWPAVPWLDSTMNIWLLCMFPHMLGRQVAGLSLGTALGSCSLCGGSGMGQQLGEKPLTSPRWQILQIVDIAELHFYLLT